MEEIIKQSFNFAQIKLFKNYSNLDSRNIFSEVEIDDITDENIAKKRTEDPFDIVGLNSFTKSYVASARSEDKVHTLRLYPKDNNKKFFYADIQVPKPEVGKYHHDYLRGPCQKIKLVRANPSCDNMSYDWFDTTKERHIKRHYNNPFAGIRIYTIERWIKKDGDKIIMKYYFHSRERNMNCKYFMKHTKSLTITFNLRTGNFTTINFDKGHRYKISSFYTNTFMSLRHTLHTIYSIKPFVSSSSPLYSRFIKEFNVELFHYAVMKVFNFNKPGSLMSFQESSSKSFSSDLELAILDFVNEWMYKFIEAKKIKAPNQCNRLLKNFYPTEKYLKKNDRKLVAAILDRFKVRSNVTIKILHEHPDISMLALVRLCYIFGKNYPKYLGNIKLEFFERSTSRDKGEDEYAKNVLLADTAPKFMDLWESEKSNLIKVINDYITNLGMYDIGTNHALIDYIYDHFNMMEKVREYYPDMRLTARTYETFSQEHIELSRIEQTIKKGYSIQYTFDEQTIREIEKPIDIARIGDIDMDNITLHGDFANITHEVFIPKILKTSEEYSEEGSYVHHCVSSYINADTSMIVSLRTGKERVTCEFYIKNRSCIQARYFSNQDPPEHYKEALIELNRRVRDCPTPLNSLEKKKIPLQINGKEIKVETEEINLFDIPVL